MGEVDTEEHPESISGADFVAFGAVLLASTAVVLFISVSGQLGSLTLPITLLSAMASWWAFLRGPRNGSLWRLLRALIVIAVSMLLVKNIVDLVG